MPMQVNKEKKKRRMKITTLMERHSVPLCPDKKKYLKKPTSITRGWRGWGL